MGDLVQIVDAIENLVTNSGFEVDASGWAADGTAVLTRDTVEKHSGVASLKVVTTAATDGAFMSPQPAGSPSTVYMTEVWVKGTGTATVGLAILPAGTIFASVTVTLTSTWQRVAVTGTTPSNATNVYTFVYQQTAGAQTMWIDDASLWSPLLDLNDETTWWCKEFHAPPPRLRRSVVENALRDGGHDSFSAYGLRTVGMQLEVRTSTQDATATQLQNLFRLLDTAEGRFLKYQPTGATKPVFFVLKRSDTTDLQDVKAQAAMRLPTVELLAEPFALGLKEPLGPFTVNNNPAAVSNGLYADLPTIIGDAPAPLVVWDDTTSQASRYFGVTHTSAAPTLVWTQAESVTLGVDTTNPGGGPDAAMSGTGTNNYVRTSFATATMQTRLTWTVPATARGRYRVLAFVRMNAASTVYTIGLGAGGAAAPSSTVRVQLSHTGRSVVDLGLWDVSDGAPETVGYSASTVAKGTHPMSVFASRDSGTGSLDWDALVMVPTGGQSDQTMTPSLMVVGLATGRMVVDAVEETVANRSVAGDPTVGVGTFSTSAAASGAFPYVQPGVSNRLHLIRFDATQASSVSASAVVSAAYWPRYLFVRPALS